jgi:hypothetical protein
MVKMQSCEQTEWKRGLIPLMPLIRFFTTGLRATQHVFEQLAKGSNLVRVLNTCT